MIHRLIAKIKAKLFRSESPRMIYGYKQKGEQLKDTRIGSTTTIIDRNALVLGDNVFIGQYNFIESSNGIEIEEGCQITNFISILTHSSHNSIRYYGKNYRAVKGDIKGYIKGSVVIGKYTFIGPHTTIMPNTRIGKGCIIAAYSLVSGDYPDFSIIGGNPAKVIGDVREKDEKFLKENPELESNYKDWSER